MNFKYQNNNISIGLYLISTVAFIILCFLFIYLSIYTAIFSIIILGLFIAKSNYVLFIENSNVKILKHFFILKNIDFQSVSNINCSIIKLRFNSFVEINFSYEYKNRTETAQLIYFKFIGTENIVTLLNNLNEKVQIDKESFSLIGIQYEGNKFLQKS